MFEAPFLQAGVDLSKLANSTLKPFRPLWISQNTRIWLNETPSMEELDFTPLILISASLPNARKRQSQSKPEYTCLPSRHIKAPWNSTAQVDTDKLSFVMVIFIIFIFLTQSCKVLILSTIVYQQGQLMRTAVWIAGATFPDGNGDLDVSFDYVPGAGDDEESWARGLTPELFWHKKEVSQPDLVPDLLQSLPQVLSQ